MSKNRLYTAVGGILFIFAAMFMVYSVWAFIECMYYIDNEVAFEGFVIRDNFFYVVKTYVDNSIKYLIYALLLIAGGFVLLKDEINEKPAGKNNPVVNKSNTEPDGRFGASE